MNWYQLAIERLGWIEVTLWYRAGSFNHLEFGHSSSTCPTPINEAQRLAWMNAKWVKRIWFALANPTPEVLREEAES